MSNGGPKLYEALCAAQAEMESASLNKENPHFKSTYADLGEIRSVSIKVLAKHGLCLTQFTKIVRNDDLTLANYLILHTRLAHKSGEYLEGEFPIPVEKPQGMGSWLTYMRRYGWSGIIALATEEDDDANAAQNAAIPKPSAHKARKERFSETGIETLKASLLSTQTPAEMEQWAKDNKDKVYALPDSWQDHFRDLYDFRLQELKNAAKPDGKLKKSEMKEPIRPKPQAPEGFDPDKWLDDLEAQFVGGKTTEDIANVWEQAMAVIESGVVMSPDRKKANELMEKHLNRVAGVA